MEFMNENNALLIKLTGFEPSDPYDDWIRNFHWASPDPNHLAELMAWCFYNPDLARALGKQARKDVIQGYSNKVIANKIMAEFQRIQKKLHSSNDASESEVRRSLPAAFQW